MGLPQESYGMTGNGRPNLYLYSPSNNTLIPCEEIIIPNPVVSTETGETAGYTGPTNIYLAYPVQGPDGRSYITQPFPIVDSSYIPSQGYPGYSHSVSYDGSSFYSSTPHTPNSGEDSGSTTQPTSPPPLVNYHPNNWFKQDSLQEIGEYRQQSFPDKVSDIMSSTDAEAITEKVINLSDNSSRLIPNANGSDSRTEAVSPPASVSTPAPTTVTYIPGLPQEQLVSKTQKKRKKKSKAKIEKCNSDDSSIIFEFDADLESCNKEINNEIQESELLYSEQVYEIQLTDDLADSLVNPPTDHSKPSEENNCSEVKEDLPSIKNEIKNEIELPDQIIKAVTNEEELKDTKTDFAKKEEEIKESSAFIPGKNEKKSKNKKSKNLKLVLKNPTPAPSPSHENQVEKTQTTESEEKKSWSSVIKSSLETTEKPEKDIIKPEPTVSKKKQQAEKKTVSVKEKREKDTSDKIVSVDSSDGWEAIPANVTQQEETWEKTLKKGKKRNKAEETKKRKEKDTNVSELTESLNHVSIVEEVSTVTKAVERPVEKTFEQSVEQPVDDADSNLIEENGATKFEDADGENERRRFKKKKKKQETAEIEEINSHRVLISDDQLQLQYAREMRAAGSREILNPSMLEKVSMTWLSSLTGMSSLSGMASVAGCCDIVYVSELGSGINRGAMNFGRLYQGKYVPPDRIDIVSKNDENEEDEVQDEVSTD